MPLTPWNNILIVDKSHHLLGPEIMLVQDLVKFFLAVAFLLCLALQGPSLTVFWANRVVLPNMLLGFFSTT